MHRERNLLLAEEELLEAIGARRDDPRHRGSLAACPPTNSSKDEGFLCCLALAEPL